MCDVTQLCGPGTPPAGAPVCSASSLPRSEGAGAPQRPALPLSPDLGFALPGRLREGGRSPGRPHHRVSSGLHPAAHVPTLSSGAAGATVTGHLTNPASIPTSRMGKLRRGEVV